MNSIRHLRLALPVALGLSAILIPSQIGAICGDAENAIPTPKCRQVGALQNTMNPAGDCPAGWIQLWDPAILGPATPGIPIPAERDSTGLFNDAGSPGAWNGWEQFLTMDAIPGIGGKDLLVTVYPYGLQVWNATGALGPNPAKLAFADGYPQYQHWLNPVAGGELSGFVNGGTAAAHNGNVFIMATAVSGVGTTIWRYNVVGNTFTQLYQDIDSECSDSSIEIIDGHPYGFAACSPGINVYDIGAIENRTSPCEQRDVSASAPQCSATLRGTLANSPLSSRYVTTTQKDEIGGSVVYAFATQGTVRDPKVCRITTPSAPEQSACANPGLSRASHSVDLFQKPGDSSTTYLGVIENRRTKIYNVTSCLDSNLCTSLPTPRLDHATGDLSSNNFTVKYSASGGTPFLYQATGEVSLKGADHEALYDLSDLSPSGAADVIPEITDHPKSLTYHPPCVDEPVDYWGDLYASNDFGYNNMVPRDGVFNGQYFYRAAGGIFDIHAFGVTAPEPDPAVEILTPTNGQMLWLDEDVQASGLATDCTAGSWSWESNPLFSLQSGGLSSTPVWNWPLNSCGGSPQCVATITASAGGDCDPASDQVARTLNDPQPSLTGVSFTVPTVGTVTEAEQCEQVSFNAEGYMGRPDEGETSYVSWSWTMENQACLAWNDTAAPEDQQPCNILDFLTQQGKLAEKAELEAQLNNATPVWDFPTIAGPIGFADGFETGDVSQWGADPGEQSLWNISAVATYTGAVRGAGSLGGPASLSVLPATTPEFGANLTVIDDATDGCVVPDGEGCDGTIEFDAGALVATAYRWELEDALGGSFCDFGAGSVPCQIFEWDPAASTLAYTWPYDAALQAGSDMKSIRVTIRTCEGFELSSNVLQEEVTPTAEVTDPPAALFRIHPDDLGVNQSDGKPCWTGFGGGVPHTCAVDAEFRWLLCTTGEGTPDEIQIDWNNDNSADVATMTFAEDLVVASCGAGERAWVQAFTFTAAANYQFDGVTDEKPRAWTTPQNGDPVKAAYNNFYGLAVVNP